MSVSSYNDIDERLNENQLFNREDDDETESTISNHTTSTSTINIEERRRQEIEEKVQEIEEKVQEIEERVGEIDQRIQNFEEIQEEEEKDAGVCHFIYDENVFDSYDEICDVESEFMDSEKFDGQYIIGLSARGFNQDGELFASGVTARTFLKYPYKHVLKYLFYSSIMLVHSPFIDIIQLSIKDDETYISICKTFWLRLLQRHWKKTVAERKRIQQKRSSVYSQVYFSIRGKYPKNLNYMPSLPGLLSCYNNDVL